MAGNLLDAVFLGTLEGLTEFLPVSSTGHILLAGHFLGFESAGKTFEVVIQLGAILAVMGVYAVRLIQLIRGLGTDPAERRFLMSIILAFLPAAVAQIMDANNISSFTLGRVFGDLGGAVDHSNNKLALSVAQL